MRRMYRYTVPVDDEVHVLALTGEPVAVATTSDRRPFDTVEFWAEHDDHGEEILRTFRVFGTGYEIPPDTIWAGTTPQTAIGIVWHLYEVKET